MRRRFFVRCALIALRVFGLDDLLGVARLGRLLRRADAGVGFAVNEGQPDGDHDRQEANDEDDGPGGVAAEAVVDLTDRPQ